MTEADLTTALRDPQLLERARTCLAETACTAEERAVAAAWLTAAARDEHQVEVKPVQKVDVLKVGTFRQLRSSAARRPTRHGAHRNGSGNPQKVPSGNLTARAVIPDPPAPAPLIHVDALRRQQQRILHRSALIDYVLAAERRSGEPLTMGDALAELLADITEAARTIGTLLQTTNGRP